MIIPLLLLLATARALLVGRDNEWTLYLHQTANFGPTIYEVEADLVLANPVNLCYSSSTSDLNGKIVLALRGNCTFLEKALNAQSGGAQGLIVGDVAEEGLIRMGANSSNLSSSVQIPCVFISNYNYLAILALLQTTTSNTIYDLQNVDLTPSDPNPVLGLKYRKSANTRGSSPVRARLDQSGEAHLSDGGPTEKIRIAGIFLLAVPALWCTLAGAYLVRRAISERIGRYRRNNRARSMPLVTYRQTPHPSDGNRDDLESAEMTRRPSSETPVEPSPRHDTQFSSSSSSSAIAVTYAPSAFFTGPLDRSSSTSMTASPLVAAGPRIHNESCAICLDDFTDGLKVKVLPCMHGFHTQCIDPWLNERSDLCPICKSSILNPHPDGVRTPCCSRSLCCNGRFFV